MMVKVLLIIKIIITINNFLLPSANDFVEVFNFLNHETLSTVSNFFFQCSVLSSMRFSINFLILLYKLAFLFTSFPC